MAEGKYKVGFEFVNKQGLNAKVVAYRGRKDIDIQFEDGTIVYKTTGSYIKKGLPLHPTYGKVRVGDKFPCHDGDEVEVIEIESYSRVLVKWKSDGATRWRSISAIKEGHNRHPTKNKYVVGDEVQTNLNGIVKVVSFNSATDVDVVFEDGTVTKTTVSLLKSGVVANPSRFDNRIGHKFKTNSGWSGEVIEYNSANDVKVKWQDGSVSKEAWGNIVSGGIQPLYQPTYQGVGYFGYGKWVCGNHKVCEGQESVDRRLMAYWERMLMRCYNEKEQAKPSSRAYIGCSVREDWHNMQNFIDWAVSKPQSTYSVGKFIWELDKDLLFDGNRIYSADTCTFLPPDINTFLSDRDWSEKCPRGVNYIKPATSGAKEGWIARCHIDGERKYLGYYDDPMIAFCKYKEVKEQYAKTLAERYSDRLERDAYLKLKDYVVYPYNTTN